MPRFPALLLALATALCGGAAVAADGGSDELHTVPLGAVAVPIVDGPRADGTLRFDAAVRARDAEVAERLKAELPRMRAETVAAGLEFGRLHASRWTAVDAERLADDLQTALRRADPGVTGVLLLEVSAG